nr:putative reverse transcriptase domain-containing protein [Tanacetum cinerariifolium]
MLRGLDKLMERKEDDGMYFIWVSLIGDVRTLIMEEAHVSRESSLIGPELLQETTGKVFLIKDKLKSARDRQKSYADNRRKLLEFEVGDQVLLKVSPWKGVIRFGKKEIMDREVKTLKRSKIPIVKVHWNSKRGPEFTWEREDHMKA